MDVVPWAVLGFWILLCVTKVSVIGLFKAQSALVIGVRRVESLADAATTVRDINGSMH